MTMAMPMAMMATWCLRGACLATALIPEKLKGLCVSDHDCDEFRRDMRTRSGCWFGMATVADKLEVLRLRLLREKVWTHPLGS
mmetsp:Transcript_71334/g.155420  ORF Transcript_71334/g.155420 Transcript_71334/m.155420 type:complete len:83 (+) Transcript_71334:372-620(+)